MSREPAVPRGEVESRLRRFQAVLGERGLDGALLVETTDLYYLAGTAQDAHLVVPADGEPILYVRRSLDRARLESPLERIEPLRSLRELPRLLADVGLAGGRIGLELDVLPAFRYLDYVARLPEHELADCGRDLRIVRAHKSEWELDRIREAGRMLAAAASRVADFLAEGVTETELAAEIERFLRRAGHQGTIRMRSFNGEIHYGAIVAGPNAAMAGGADTAIVGLGPNAAIGKGASSRPIRRGETVVVDLVGAYDGYLADQTRTFSVGSVAEPFAEAYAAALSILHELEAATQAGAVASELYDRAVALADGRPGFMGREGDHVSFVGHGLGLEIDEPPFVARGSADVLEPGMVVALEPKFVLDAGAVGVENTYLVTPDSAESLTPATEEIVHV